MMMMMNTKAATLIPAIAPVLNPSLEVFLTVLFSIIAGPVAMVEKEFTVFELIWPVIELEVKDAVDCTFQPMIGMARTSDVEFGVVMIRAEIKSGKVYEELL